MNRKTLISALAALALLAAATPSFAAQVCTLPGQTPCDQKTADRSEYVAPSTGGTSPAAEVNVKEAKNYSFPAPSDSESNLDEEPGVNFKTQDFNGPGQ